MIRILSRTKKGISNGVRVTFRNVRSNLLSSTHKREIRRPRCPIQFGSPPTKLSTLSFSVNKDIRASSQKQWCRSRNLRGPEMATVSPVCIAASVVASSASMHQVEAFWYPGKEKEKKKDSESVVAFFSFVNFYFLF